MTLLKKVVIVLAVTILAVLILNFSCKKELEMVGFAYKDDKITISPSGVNFRHVISIDSINNKVPNADAISFYSKISYFSLSDSTSFRVRIQSKEFVVLDTNFVLAKRLKRPVISFKEPKGPKFKRSLFILDGSDKRYPRY